MTTNKATLEIIETHHRGNDFVNRYGFLHPTSRQTIKTPFFFEGRMEKELLTHLNCLYSHGCSDLYIGFLSIEKSPHEIGDLYIILLSWVPDMNCLYTHGCSDYDVSIPLTAVVRRIFSFFHLSCCR